VKKHPWWNGPEPPHQKKIRLNGGLPPESPKNGLKPGDNPRQHVYVATAEKKAKK